MENWEKQQNDQKWEASLLSKLPDDQTWRKSLYLERSLFSFEVTSNFLTFVKWFI